MSVWSSGMIPASGAGGPGFKPRNGPIQCTLLPPPYYSTGYTQLRVYRIRTRGVKSHRRQVSKFGTTYGRWLFLSNRTYFCNISYLGTYTQHITHQSADFHNHPTTNTNCHFAPHHHRTQPKTKDSLIIFIINIIMMPLPLSGS